MRTLLLLLPALVASPAVATAQQPAGHPVLVDDVPAGAKWIANSKTSTYYAVGCPATLSIPEAGRLYYKSESSLQAAGFTKGTDCNPGGSLAAARAPDSAGQDQEEQERPLLGGFWVNAGLGYGSAGCENCNSRIGSSSRGLALGKALNRKIILGVGANWWTNSDPVGSQAVATVAPVVRFYPSDRVRYFLLGGLGLGVLHTSTLGIGSTTETGLGALLGLGMDIRVYRNVSLTPFCNGFAAAIHGHNVNVGQLGLGVTVQ